VECAVSLRILHVLDHSIPLHSGYTFRTLSILREQRKLGWETFHLTSPKQGATQRDEEDVEGLHFFRTPPGGREVPLPGMREWALVRRVESRLEDVARRVRPDLLHAHSPVLDCIPALRVGRRLGLPVVYEVRAFWEDAAVDHGTTREGSLRYRATRALESYALRHVQHVTTICEGLKRDIVERGVPEAKITVIPNAVDVDRFRFQAPADAALKRRLGLENAAVVGFVGSFYAYEGLDLLIDALPRVLADLPSARLLLVGGGPQERALKEQAQRLGVGDRIVFPGRVPHAEVEGYYSAIDLLAYPRRSMRLTELVTPLKPLEAMAQGHLVVASDVGGHRELIRDGVNGTLFRAGDVGALAATIVARLRDRSTWTRMREAGRAFVESERTWSESVSRYRQPYSLLTGREA
jgi:PEP-CTERM/exosortase A-associated glycosyltransferase